MQDKQYHVAHSGWLLRGATLNTVIADDFTYIFVVFRASHLHLLRWAVVLGGVTPGGDPFHTQRSGALHLHLVRNAPGGVAPGDALRDDRLRFALAVFLGEALRGPVRWDAAALDYLETGVRTDSSAPYSRSSGCWW